MHFVPPTKELKRRNVSESHGKPINNVSSWCWSVFNFTNIKEINFFLMREFTKHESWLERKKVYDLTILLWSLKRCSVFYGTRFFTLDSKVNQCSIITYASWRTSQRLNRICKYFAELFMLFTLMLIQNNEK